MTIHIVFSSLRNAGLAKKSFACVPLTKINFSLLDLLYSEGLISGYSIQKHKYNIKVQISYLGSDLPLISSLKTVSRPGLRKYLCYNDLINHYSGRFLILNTNIGLITGTKAIIYRKGGELCAIRYYFL